MVDGNDPEAGNAAVTRIGFSGLSGLISKIDITGTTSGGTRNIGIAFDNFQHDGRHDHADPSAAARGALCLLRARRNA